MSNDNTEISNAALVSLHKIVWAMDLQSRQLQRDCVLTSLQLVLLREIVRQNEIPIGALAAHASLSNVTVTGIVDRLEQRGLVVRNRNGKDRRQVLLSSTETGNTLCASAPPLMQKQFLAFTAVGAGTDAGGIIASFRNDDENFQNNRSIWRKRPSKRWLSGLLPDVA